MRYINSLEEEREILRNDVLNFFVQEILASQVTEGYTFWMVSPWIYNVIFSLENRGPFENIFPDANSISLTDVLRKLLDFGGKINIATLYSRRDIYKSSTAKTLDFLQQVQRLAPGQVEIRYFSDLHTKMYVGEYGALVGSANFTYGGLFSNKECVASHQSGRRVKELAEKCARIFNSQENRVQPSGLDEVISWE